MPVIVALIVISFHSLTSKPIWVEVKYSLGIYQSIVTVLRLITSRLPFSLGDLLYIVLATWIVILTVQFIKRKPDYKEILSAIKRLVCIIVILWMIFQALWGLNYHRAGIAYHTQLKPVSYSTDTLIELCDSLVRYANKERHLLGNDYTFPGVEEAILLSESAYLNKQGRLSYLPYQLPSVKKSLYGHFLNYLGVLGYYNPFTGEAQINKQIPAAVLPFTICHEIAHQTGIGSESEASFAAYLVSMESESVLLKYSAHFELLLYAISELNMRNSSAAKKVVNRLSPEVMHDWKQYREYAASFENPIEKLISLFYGYFLELNNQPDGIDSYNAVVAWVSAYEYKKQ